MLIIVKGNKKEQKGTKNRPDNLGHLGSMGPYDNLEKELYVLIEIIIDDYLNGRMEDV